MLDKISQFIHTVDGYVWGWGMIVLLLGTHLYFTVRLKFIQIPTLTKGIKLSVTKDKDAEGDVSAFAAFATSLAATIGTGNIVGVGTAIALGGPGAVLWCWLTGVFGIATKYAESLIAIKYRVKTRDGRMQGGAMYALERGLNMKWLVIEKNFHVPMWVTGLGIGLLTAVVIFGGIKSIASVCEKLVPVMALFYVIGCIVVLVYNYDYIIPAIKVICRLAFTKGAVAGGLVGGGIRYAIQYGVARGLFSNESGLGAAPIAAAAAQTKNPVRQSLISATGTFWDTVCVCALTGIVLVSSIMKNPEISVNNIENGGVLTSLAFAQIPYFGPIVLTLGIITFAYSTILGWAYYGERCIEYFAGKKSIIPYRIVYVLISIIAPIVTLNTIWEVTDILNALMAIPNLIAVLLLSKVIVKETNKYMHNLDRVDTTEIPVIDD